MTTFQQYQQLCDILFITLLVILGLLSPIAAIFLALGVYLTALSTGIGAIISSF